MAQIDTRFLSPSKETLAWFRHAEECRRCANLLEDTGYRGERIMRCAAVPAIRGSSEFANCIDARMRDWKCGPMGLLFKPKEAP